MLLLSSVTLQPGGRANQEVAQAGRRVAMLGAQSFYDCHPASLQQDSSARGARTCWTPPGGAQLRDTASTWGARWADVGMTRGELEAGRHTPDMLSLLCALRICAVA